MKIQKIIDFLEPPKSPSEVEQTNWPVIEKRYQIDIPEDFRSFVENYGTGSISEFLWILNPFSANDFLNFEASKEYQQTYSELKTELPDEFVRPLFPAEGSLFPFAATDNGDVFCWIIGADPQQKMCSIIGSEGAEEIQTEMNFTDFILSILQGQIGEPILPDDFLRQQKTFIQL